MDTIIYPYPNLSNICSQQGVQEIADIERYSAC